MSMSKTAEATRSVLKQYRDAALDGTLTVDQVVSLVKQVVPSAQREGIYNAIGAYGPIGEGAEGLGDTEWYERAQKPQIPSWFYSPHQGRRPYKEGEVA